jgi:type IV pilus assembly protein PilM
MKLPSLSQPNLKLGLSLGRRGGGPEVVGLDIQPGFVAAVQARVNGTVLAEKAALRPLGADTVRDGEVADESSLSEVLRELFSDSGLPKRVRVGVANQRTVLRTLELPPVTDSKELAAAVTFQAQDQVPMPLNNAVLDFHPLGIFDTPAGPRQRVVLVAAQRDMVERLLAAVRGAGLNLDGVDLSAFALIRSLYRADPEQAGSRVVYLNVDGLTNLAIAEGKVCRFTRVVGGGLEGMAVELAERRGIALADARELLAAVDLSRPAPVAHESVSTPEPPAAETVAPGAQLADAAAEANVEGDPASARGSGPDAAQEPPAEPVADEATEEADLEESPVAASNADVRTVMENGIRDLSGEVRNSLDFHRSQDDGVDVSHVVLSGAAEQIPGFAAALELALGVPVRPQAVGVVDEHSAEHVFRSRLAVATGLATAEAPQ